MLGFLKKLFGMDKETMKDAGVKLDQAPYKIEPPLPEATPELAPVSQTSSILEAVPAEIKKESSNADVKPKKKPAVKKPVSEKRTTTKKSKKV